MRFMKPNGYMKMTKYKIICSCCEDGIHLGELHEDLSKKKQTEAGTSGAVAQLGERRVCNADVGSSILSSSTKK